MTNRRKGKEGELAIGRMLYRFWFGNEPNKDRDVFVRTKGGVRQDMGDLTVPDDFPFFVEVKNRIFHPINDIASIQAFAKDIAVKAAKHAKLGGLLFFRLSRNRWGVVVACPNIGFNSTFWTATVGGIKMTLMDMDAFRKFITDMRKGVNGHNGVVKVKVKGNAKKAEVKVKVAG